MTLRSYLILMAAGTAVSAGAVWLILQTVDPLQAGGATFAIFYACLFLAITGILSILGFSARVFILDKRLLISREVVVSFRQAALVAIMAIAGMYLKTRGLFNWWTGILIIVVVTLLESFFISAKMRRPEER